MKKKKDKLYVVRYSSGNFFKFEITLDRPFKSEQAALEFIAKVRESDEKQGIVRKIEYLGKEPVP